MHAPAARTARRAPLTLLLILLALLATASPRASVAQEIEPAAAGDHLVTNIALGPDSPNILVNGQDVNLSYTYSTTQAGGVRIFARPFSNGELSPSYAAHGSPIYPQSASNSASGSFTITNGQVVVDQIRIQMLTADQSALLFEVFIPVYYLFSDSPHLVTNIDLDVDTPDVLPFGQNVNATFNYRTRDTGGVRIFMRPFTNGSLTPNYAAHGSPIYPISGGDGTGSFTISSGQVVVDQIRIQVLNANQTTLLFEAFLPVYYRFRSANHSVTSIELRPDTPNVFTYSQNVNLTFNYSTNQSGGVRIFARPFSGAGLSANYAAHGSPIYPAGTGSGTGSFRLSAGPLAVDKIRVQMWDANQTTLLSEAFLPVYLLWAGAGPPPGPDMRVDAIEVTQAIQDLNNSVDLIAGKRTYVRVHVSSPVNVNDVFATLSGRRGVVALTPTLNPGNPGSDITVRTNPNREQINDSFWFELPSGWTTAGNLTLTARLDPINAKNDLVQSNNVRAVTVNFLNAAPLQLRLMNVRYTSGGTTYQADSSQMAALESWLRRAYPISNLQVTRQTFVYPSSGLPNVDTLNTLLAVSKVLRILFSGEDARVVYYGFVDDGGGFMRGKAAGVPGTIASGPTGSGDFGWDFDGSYGDWYGGHEIGHTRGRAHAEFCGADGGTSYPYPGGRISPALTGNTAIYGFDITSRAIYGPTWKDVMTYCANQWISDFTYEGIRNYMAGVGPLSDLEASAAPLGDVQPSVTANQFLVVAGTTFLEDNTVALTSVSLIQQSATVPLPEPGDWTIALVGASNNDLATYPFAPDELTDAEESRGRPAIIAEVVPWSAGAVRVEIRRGGQVLASRSASANPPTVSFTAPAAGTTLPNGPFQVSWSANDPDGNALTFSLLYSNDGGTTWQPVATDLTGTSVQLNTDQLPGGTAQLRIIASDGFLTGQATSGTFTVPRHAPIAQITLPAANQIFFPTQQVVFEANGYDTEDGTLGDGAFTWSSSIDGALGSGATLSTSELSTGTHTITLTATDRDGQSTQVTRTISVANESAAEPSTLAVAPFALSTTVAIGGAAVQQTLSIHSAGESEFAWTASKNSPWLSLATSSGQTPGELVVTIDASQLPAGTHSSQVVITSTQAGVSPVTVPVTVVVIGRALYLPLIGRG
jgi:hypothetical protein